MAVNDDDNDDDDDGDEDDHQWPYKQLCNLHMYSIHDNQNGSLYPEPTIFNKIKYSCDSRAHIAAACTLI